MGGLIVVSASYDADADLWSAHSADLGGMFLQATSWKILVQAVPGAVGKLLPRGLFRPAHDIAIEVISHAGGPANRPASRLADASRSIHSGV